MSKKYNGHINRNAWNISLWLNNDEGLYLMAKDAKNATNNLPHAAECMLASLHECGSTHTPDGVKWTKTNIRRALAGIE